MAMEIRNDNRKITRLGRPKFTHPFLNFGLSKVMGQS
jgi:hypothetical protein